MPQRPPRGFPEVSPARVRHAGRLLSGFPVGLAPRFAWLPAILRPARLFAPTYQCLEAARPHEELVIAAGIWMGACLELAPHGPVCGQQRRRAAHGRPPPRSDGRSGGLLWYDGLVGARVMLGPHFRVFGGGCLAAPLSFTAVEAVEREAPRAGADVAGLLMRSVARSTGDGGLIHLQPLLPT